MRKPGDPGLQSAIRGFFQRNPDEELSMLDCMTKWDATRKQVQDAICHLRRGGLRIQNDGVVVRVLG